MKYALKSIIHHASEIQTRTSAPAHGTHMTQSCGSVCFGRDSDLYELMQALEVMAQLLPKFHGPPNLAASAKRFNSPILCPTLHPLRLGTARLGGTLKMTFTQQHAGVLDLTYHAWGFVRRGEP